ncbi:hypothetical protein B0H10DRAFT_1952879 [Mycena sp. CBHHK59/15]|nr:hypothetical protein B0H10DRAFT_1952879 [Mycena sp. CBHHK59/15]
MAPSHTDDSSDEEPDAPPAKPRRSRDDLSANEVLPSRTRDAANRQPSRKQASQGKLRAPYKTLLTAIPTDKENMESAEQQLAKLQKQVARMKKQAKQREKAAKGAAPLDDDELESEERSDNEGVVSFASASLALAATAISESIRERFEEKTRSMMLPEIVSVSLREEVGDLGAGCSIGGVIGEGWTAVQVASEGPGGGSGLNEFGEFRPEVAGGGISRVPRGVDTEDAVDEVLLVASLQDYINSNYASAEDSGGYVHLLRDLDSFADAEFK